GSRTRSAMRSRRRCSRSPPRMRGSRCREAGGRHRKGVEVMKAAVKETESLNAPQRDTLKRLRELLPMAHTVDIKLRVNGEDWWFQGDFLKFLLGDADL